jgi:hypothetical protein
MPWVLMTKPNGKRLMLNLDLTFCFDEQDDGSAQAVSINGIGAPTGVSMDTTISEIMQEEK